jgi:hypothetical protein
MSPRTKNRIERMKASIMGFLKGLKAISEQYFLVASVIGVLWGGFVIYDNWRDSNKILQTNVTKIIETQMRQGKTDSLLLVNQSEIQSQLQGIQATTKSLESSYVKYISNDKTLTKQDFLRYMEGLSFDVKKKLNDIRTDAYKTIDTIPQVKVNTVQHKAMVVKGDSLTKPGTKTDTTKHIYKIKVEKIK